MHNVHSTVSFYDKIFSIYTARKDSVNVPYANGSGKSLSWIPNLGAEGGARASSLSQEDALFYFSDLQTRVINILQNLFF